MKIGDRVRVIGVPPDLPPHDPMDDPCMRTVFGRSVGKCFPIIDITPAGLIELEVGKAVGVASYLHSIWIEAEFVEPDGSGTGPSRL